MQAVYWARLAQAHLRSNNITAAKQVFSRCMLTCLSMDVWMTYLQFIKQVRDRCSGPRDTHRQMLASLEALCGWDSCTSLLGWLAALA